MNPLNDEWVLWFHNPKDENWDLESYKKVVTLKTIEDFWRVHLLLDTKKIQEGMFFLMKNDIETKYLRHFDSISSLHAIEHFGLGRYGDKLDPIGHIKGIENLQKYLKKNGLFYLSVPVGSKSKIYFNAHRVFTIKEILNIFSKDYEFVSLELLNDQGDKLPFQNLEDNLEEIDFEYGCGIFTFEKK